MRFRGDTLGINIWLGWFIPVSCCLQRSPLHGQCVICAASGSV
jgi:hypothetical protein